MLDDSLMLLCISFIYNINMYNYIIHYSNLQGLPLGFVMVFFCFHGSEYDTVKPPIPTAKCLDSSVLQGLKARPTSPMQSNQKSVQAPSFANEWPLQRWSGTDSWMRQYIYIYDICIMKYNYICLHKVTRFHSLSGMLYTKHAGRVNREPTWSAAVDG